MIISDLKFVEHLYTLNKPEYLKANNTPWVFFKQGLFCFESMVWSFEYSVKQRLVKFKPWIMDNEP